MAFKEIQVRAALIPIEEFDRNIHCYVITEGEGIQNPIKMCDTRAEADTYLRSLKDVEAGRELRLWVWVRETETST